MTPANVANQLAIDVNSLAQTKRLAREDPRAALKNAAQQFEAVFLQMVLKSMRDASPAEGMFDSAQSRMYQSMLDQQLAQTMSARGSTGLSALIEQQLARGMSPQDIPLSPASAGERAGVRGATADVGAPPLTPALSPPGGERENNVPAPAREFVNRLWSQAGEASRATGIPAHFMIAQAALETGWGRAELRFSDGTPTYNLFGIKAGRGWPGAVAEVTTTEYVNGVARKVVAKFRAYDSYEASFRDYARLITENPRYEKAQATAKTGSAVAYAAELQKAGYATDPAYAKKLGGAIQSALRAQQQA